MKPTITQEFHEFTESTRLTILLYSQISQSRDNYSLELYSDDMHNFPLCMWLLLADHPRIQQKQFETSALTNCPRQHVSMQRFLCPFIQNFKPTLVVQLHFTCTRRMKACARTGGTLFVVYWEQEPCHWVPTGTHKLGLEHSSWCKLRRHTVKVSMNCKKYNKCNNELIVNNDALALLFNF